MLQWLLEHPQYLLVQLFIGGDSYSGLIVPLITQKVVEGMHSCVNLKFNKLSGNFCLYTCILACQAYLCNYFAANEAMVNPYLNLKVHLFEIYKFLLQFPGN